MRAIALLALLTSCSFVFTSGPDSGPPRAYPRCTSSMAWPVVDGVLTALFLTATITAIATDEKSSSSLDDDGESSKAAQITSSALFTAMIWRYAFPQPSDDSSFEQPGHITRAQFAGLLVLTMASGWAWKMERVHSRRACGAVPHSMLTATNSSPPALKAIQLLSLSSM